MDILIHSMHSRLLDLMELARIREVVGTVVNIFDRVINVETSHPTSLLTIANTKVISAPYMLKISDEAEFDHLRSTLDIGDIIRFNNIGEMRVNNDRLLYGTAFQWNCSMQSMLIKEQELLKIAHEVKTFLKEEGNSGGILNAFLSQSSSSDEHSPFLSIYDSYFKRLIRQLSEDFSGNNLKKFVGLGVGLTPSGDDFIVGLLAALHSYDPTGKLEKVLKDQMNKESITNKTTRVSSHMISYALDDEFNEALLNLLSGDHQISRSLKRVNSIGSTSGTDMLAGVCFGLDQIIKEYKRRE